MLFTSVVSFTLIAIATAKPIPRHVPVPRQSSSSVSLNGWGGFSQMDNFDNFFGANNFDGSNNPINLVSNNLLQCQDQNVNIIQQQLAVLQQLAQSLILQQSCQAEVQTFLMGQFLGGLNDFNNGLQLQSEQNPLTFDNNIASQVSQFGNLINQDGSINSFDLGFNGDQIGQNAFSVGGNNFNGQNLGSIQQAAAAVLAAEEEASALAAAGGGVSPFLSNGQPLSESGLGVPLSTTGFPLSENGIPISTAGVPLAGSIGASTIPLIGSSTLGAEGVSATGISIANSVPITVS